MVEPIEISDSEFSAQLQALVIEAGQAREPRRPAKSEPAKALVAADFEEILRPVMEGIALLNREQGEQRASIEKLDKGASVVNDIPQALADTRQAIESRNVVNRAMFEALHSELKTYKDGFILESILRPVIRDLISVYDEMSAVHRQLTATISSFEEKEIVGGAIRLLENMKNAVMNLDHNVHFILEVLERMEVSICAVAVGKLDKRSQKAVAVELTECPDEDQDIVKSTKRGFQWKDRIVRPEEVVIKKWKEPLNP